MPDPTVTEKPKPRRRRAKRPAADPTAPKRPRVTLRSRIEAMGPTHLAAYRVLCDGAEFDAALRDALDSRRRVDEARFNVERYSVLLDRAKTALDAAEDDETAGLAVLAKLDRVARTIAQERGDVPADDATAPTVAPASDED